MGPGMRCDGPPNGEGSGATRRTPHSKNISRPVSRVLEGTASLARERYATAIPLGRCLHMASSNLPGRSSLTQPCGVIALRRTARVAVPIRFCSRWGLPCRFRCRTRGALLPHLFTLTAPKPRGAKAGGSFSVALSLGSPPPDVIRHRMSMEPGLSSPAAFRHLPERPSGRLTGAGMGAAARGVKRYRPLGGAK